MSKFKREIRGRLDHQLERFYNVRRDISELFRRSAAELDMHHAQAAVNAANADVHDAQDEINGAIFGELTRLNEDATELGRLVGTDVRELRARLDALEADRGALADPLQGARYAIAQRLVIQFKYRDREGVPSYRVLSPYEVRTAHLAGGAYVVGYDHGREGIRQLRLSRIEGLVTITDIEPYRPPTEREETA